MRALALDHPGTVPEVRDIPAPVAPPGGVVLQVEAAGLCRSDWHAAAGHDETVAFPHVPGHELVGRIAAVGDGVTRWHVGDRVTSPFVCGCGACAWCREGQSQVCPEQTQPGFTHFGAFAEQVVLHAADHNLVAAPEALPAEAIVPLGCRFATAFRGLRQRAQVREGELVAVIGCGGVGLSAVMIAAALGARVIAVDVSPHALALAERHGARHAVLTAGLEPESAAAAIIAAAGERPTVTVEALGRDETLETCLLALAPLGRHVQIGLFAQPPVTALPRIISQEITLLGSHGMSASGYGELLEMVSEGRLRPQDLVTASIGLEEAGPALMAMGTAPPAGITIIRP